jgi:hypothetical protein
MQTSNQTPSSLDKGFIKAGDLQRQLAALRREQPDARPMDAAHALLQWFQEPDNEHVRLDVLYYAISHAWGTVTSKIEEAPVEVRRAAEQRIVASVQQNRATRSKKAAVVAEAVDEAIEQMFATLRSMTFKQARMVHGATAKLDLAKGKDDQRLGDVFTDAEIRAALV